MEDELRSRQKEMGTQLQASVEALKRKKTGTPALLLLGKLTLTIAAGYVGTFRQLARGKG